MTATEQAPVTEAQVEKPRHLLLILGRDWHVHPGAELKPTPKEIVAHRNLEGSSNCADSSPQMTMKSLVHTYLDFSGKDAVAFTPHLRDSQAEYDPTISNVAGWFKTYPEDTNENVSKEDAIALLGYDDIRAVNALKKIQGIIAQRKEAGLPGEIIYGTETSIRPVIKDGKVVAALFDSKMVDEGRFQIVVASIHYPSVPELELVNKDPEMYSDLAVLAVETGKVNIFGHPTAEAQFYPAKFQWQRFLDACRKKLVAPEVNLGGPTNFIQDVSMNRKIYPDLKPGEKNIWIKDLEILLHYNPSEEDRNHPQSEALEKLGISPNLLEFVKAKEKDWKAKGKNYKRVLDLPLIPLLSDPKIREIIKDQIAQGLVLAVDTDLHKLPKMIEKSVSEEGETYPEMMPLRFTEAAIIIERRFNELFAEMGVDPEKSVINLWPLPKLKKWLKKEV